MKSSAQALVLEDLVHRLSQELAERQGVLTSGAHAGWLDRVEELPPLLLAYDLQMQAVTHKMQLTGAELVAAHAQACALLLGCRMHVAADRILTLCSMQGDEQAAELQRIKTELQECEAREHKQPAGAEELQARIEALNEENELLLATAMQQDKDAARAGAVLKVCVLP